MAGGAGGGGGRPPFGLFELERHEHQLPPALHMQYYRITHLPAGQSGPETPETTNGLAIDRADDVAR